eukprot:1147806-Pelagomonas_calceolata.AAC.3
MMVSILVPQELAVGTETCVSSLSVLVLEKPNLIKPIQEEINCIATSKSHMIACLMLFCNKLCTSWSYTAAPCFLLICLLSAHAQFRVLFANVVALFWSIFLLQRAKKLANNTVKQKQEQDKHSAQLTLEKVSSSSIAQGFGGTPNKAGNSNELWAHQCSYPMQSANR